jgi:hypothetical protein
MHVRHGELCETLPLFLYDHRKDWVVGCEMKPCPKSNSYLLEAWKMLQYRVLSENPAKYT